MIFEEEFHPKIKYDLKKINKTRENLYKKIETRL